MVAQVIHAAGESALHLWKQDEELEYAWSEDRACECAHSYVRGYGHAFREGCGICAGYGMTTPVIHAVALAAKDEAELLKLDAILHEKEISHRTIREPDPPWFGQAMAIGIEPVRDRSALRRLLSRFPLIRAGNSVGRDPSSSEAEVGGSIPPPRTNAIGDRHG